MLRTQRWVPDTHPNISLDTQWDDAEPDAAHVCVKATIDGVTTDDPQGVYELVLEENRLKNHAYALLIANLPADMTKPVLDSDGDETGERTVKDKHAPVWEYGEADGKLAFTVPGAPDDVLASLRAVLADAFGDAVAL